jgi:hypothetical protein
MLSRRHCCLCVFLDGKDTVVQGQIAHLNHDPSDSSFNNLVFLCLRHHDAYDTQTSQSKRLTANEVRRWRDKLYEGAPQANIEEPSVSSAKLPALPTLSVFEETRRRHEKAFAHLNEPWRSSPAQMANFMEYFAYKTHGADGICHALDAVCGR